MLLMDAWDEAIDGQCAMCCHPVATLLAKLSKNMNMMKRFCEKCGITGRSVYNYMCNSCGFVVIRVKDRNVGNIVLRKHELP